MFSAVVHVSTLGSHNPAGARHKLNVRETASLHVGKASQVGVRHGNAKGMNLCLALGSACSSRNEFGSGCLFHSRRIAFHKSFSSWINLNSPTYCYLCFHPPTHQTIRSVRDTNSIFTIARRSTCKACQVGVWHWGAKGMSCLMYRMIPSSITRCIFFALIEFFMVIWAL